MSRPDEGLIHAWLDGQLPPDEAARIERLAATDAEWGAAVAEARGLVAASSRILSALDHVPAGVIPPRAAAPVRRRMPWWTKAAAAVVLVAGGSALVLQRAPVPVANPPRIERAVSETAPAVAPTAEPSARALVQAEERPSAAPSMESRVATAAPPEPTAAKAPEIPERMVSAVPAPPALAREAVRDAARAAEPVAEPAAVREATTERPPATPATARAFAAAPTTADAAVPQARAVLEATESATRRATNANSAKSAVGAGRVGVAGLAPPDVSGGCYAVRAVQAPNTVVVMRAVGADGDTLRLQSASVASTLRAWLVVHDGTGRGAMTSAADGSGAVAVVATVAPCSTP